jgi:hypothetical protein
MRIVTTTDLSLFETTKAQRQDFAQSVINSLKEGHTDPLKVHLQVKCLEDIVKQLTTHPEYKDLALEEASKHGKSFELHNAKFEIKEAGVKYDYSNCGDPVYNDLAEKLAELEKEIKDRQAFLKAVKPGTEILVEDEIVILYPPVKTSTTSITVNLK